MTQALTEMFAAPEIIRPSQHYDGAPADVWSAGVQLYVSLLYLLPEKNHLFLSLARPQYLTGRGALSLSQKESRHA